MSLTTFPKTGQQESDINLLTKVPSEKLFLCISTISFLLTSLLSLTPTTIDTTGFFPLRLQILRFERMHTDLRQDSEWPYYHPGCAAVWIDQLGEAEDRRQGGCSLWPTATALCRQAAARRPMPLWLWHPKRIHFAFVTSVERRNGKQ